MDSKQCTQQGALLNLIIKKMNLKNSIYNISFAAMLSMMTLNGTETFAQNSKETFPIVAAQKGDKAFTLEDLNFGGNN